MTKSIVSKDKEKRVKNFSEKSKSSDHDVIKNDWYKTIIYNALDGFFLENINGDIMDVNDSFCSMIGYSRKELLTMNLRDIDVHFINNPEFFQRDTLRMIETESFSREVRHRRKDGRVLDVMVSSKYLDVGEGFLFCFNRDITKHKKAERKIKRYQEHLEDIVAKRTNELQEQIEQRIEFTRALVHELKTPLTPLIGASEILALELESEPYKSYASSILKGANQLSMRIDELVDVAKGEVGLLELNCRELDPLSLLHEVINYMTPEAKRRNQVLCMDSPASLRPIYGDSERLKQILLNLLANAFKFTPKGGRISLKAREDDSRLMIEVVDNGTGIDDKAQRLLFKPYQQTEKTHLGGLGLGLSLCKMLVDLHGGNIEVKSKKGEGTTVSFSIPSKGKRGLTRQGS